MRTCWSPHCQSYCNSRVFGEWRYCLFLGKMGHARQGMFTLFGILGFKVQACQGTLREMEIARQEIHVGMWLG